MTDTTLLLEGAQGCPNRGIARRIQNAVQDLSNGRFAALEEEVHDLPLSAAQAN
jgi:hypothetical protein